MIQRITSATAALVRCAIYTRKSTEEGLDQEYNTLDAQRDAGEAFVASQQHEGWVPIEQRYDDGGFSDGNMERPALKRLIEDIEAGLVDCVIVYKVDRLSRSLMDFSKIIEVFDRHGVSFVSVTQQFNTATSMGRLVLNVLLSFAQFEREMISERTRDKIAATRRKGKWSGGQPLLGYTVVDRKLHVVPDEAERVRQIFGLYLQQQSLLATVKEIDRRGWHTKQWTTKSGVDRGGKPFTRTSLHSLLKNVTYVGKVGYKGEAFDGEHEAIVSMDVFESVQSALKNNRQHRSASVRNKYNALLRGLLHCAPCGCAMSHSYTRKNSQVYRYYVCQHAQKTGWDTCPSPSIPAAEIERFVLDEIRAIGHDDLLTRDVLMRAQQLSGRHGTEPNLTLTEVRSVLGQFDELWNTLPTVEKIRLIGLLIERVEYDGECEKIRITFQSAGVAALGNFLSSDEGISS